MRGNAHVRCGGRPGKRARRNPGTAPRPDPYVIGKNGLSAIATLAERSSRFTLIMALPGDRTAATVSAALAATITTLPAALRRSLTWDQGKELSGHAAFTIATGLPVYFADPHSPWQRGTNENTNGLIRYYYPKGVTGVRAITQAQPGETARKLNTRPRRTPWLRHPRRNPQRPPRCNRRLTPASST